MVYFDFIGPVVDAGMITPQFNNHPIPFDGFTYITPVPPNFLADLLSLKALTNLRDGMGLVRATFGQHFGKFDIHTRGIFESNDESLLFPGDVLTYVEFKGLNCYTPINVSLSHRIMTSIFSVDPEEDLEIKRRFIEQQIFYVTQSPTIPGLDIAIYGVSFPAKFSHGKTDMIFRQYQSFAQTDPEWFNKWKCYKKVFNLGEGFGDYVFYFFGGKGLMNNSIEEIVEDPAFQFYNTEISRRWNENFKHFSTIESTTPTNKLTVEAALEILKQKLS